MNQIKEDCFDCQIPNGSRRFNQQGFSLVEVTIAMVILLIVLLGVFVTFTYAVNYNAGNNSRAQALAVLRREVELYRSAKFTPNVTDNYTPPATPSSPDDGRRDLTGGVKTPRVVTSADDKRFRVAVIVDDDPFTANAPANPQVDTTNKSVTMKEISITVTLDSPTPGWQTSLPATVVLRRVRAN